MNFEIDAVKSVLVGLIGWLFYSIRKIDKKAEAAVGKEDVHAIVTQRIAELKVRQEEMIKDVLRLEAKIDHLIELHIRSINKD